jgi:hypothetical protein
MPRIFSYFGRIPTNSILLRWRDVFESPNLLTRRFTFSNFFYSKLWLLHLNHFRFTSPTDFTEPVAHTILQFSYPSSRRKSTAPTCAFLSIRQPTIGFHHLRQPTIQFHRQPTIQFHGLLHPLVRRTVDTKHDHSYVSSTSTTR